MAKKKQHYSGIGGQAVLEGVMMRNQNLTAVACRKPDREIEIEVEEYHGLLEGTVWRKLPFVRGVFSFIDSLILAVKSLNFSASVFAEEEDPKAAKQQKKDGNGSDALFMGITTVISFVIAIGIFMLLPYFLTQLIGGVLRSQSVLSILEGVIRIAIFLLYITAISAMKDIRRLYQYHGAEHKCINCIESGRPLTVANVKQATRFHKRCGTSFIIFVMLVSVILFFFIRVDGPFMRILLRILLIPVIAGISFELIRLAGRSSNPVVQLLSAPGLWMQRITTREPDESMIEVAIASVEAVFDWRAYLADEFGYDERKLDRVDTWS